MYKLQIKESPKQKLRAFHIDKRIYSRKFEKKYGYTSNFSTAGCRSWQEIAPMVYLYDYWIDLSSLSSLTSAQQTQFIQNVDKAAAIWNSTRMHDGTGTIVTLTKKPATVYL